MNSGLYAFAGDSATATAAAWANRLDEPMTNVSNVYFGLSRLPPRRRAAGARARPRPVPAPIGRPLADRRAVGRRSRLPVAPGPAVRPGGRRGRPARTGVRPSTALAPLRPAGAGAVAATARRVGRRSRRARRRPADLVGVGGSAAAGSSDAVDRCGGRAAVGRRAAAVLRRPHGDRDLDRPAQPAGQRVGDRRAQPGLDHVPGEGVGHREQSGVLDDRPQPGQPEVRPLLRRDDLVGQLVGRRRPDRGEVDRVGHRRATPIARSRLAPRRPPPHDRTTRVRAAATAVHRLSTACVSTDRVPTVTDRRPRRYDRGVGAGSTVPND